MKNDEEEDDDEGNESEAEGAQLLNVGTGDPSISEVRKKKNRSPQGNAEDGGFELSAADTGCPAHHPDASVAAAQPEGEEADETG